jgi:GT2 family glycosyltransferase
VRQDCDFLFFLDDDVIVSKDYLCVMTSAFSDEYVVGVSGIASNVEGHFETEDAWLAKIYKYFFMLDSRIDGAILSSGVSIPVRRDGVRQAQWLIGCAAWRYRNLGVTRFESDMYGYTLGEDVIFSVRMSQKGRLLVLTNIVIDHKESPKGRPGACDFWCSWMTYRWRLVSLGSLTWQKRSSYWWASFGQLIINLVGEYCLHNKPTGSSRGILQGAMQIIRRVQN